jgi:branched-chain amino acid transport system permease protein
MAPGAFVGAAFILFVPNVTEHFSQGLSGAVYGLMLIRPYACQPGGFAEAERIASSFLKKPSV